MTEIAKGVLFSTLTVILSVVTSMLVKILAQDDIAIIHILISRFWFSLPILFVFAFAIHQYRLFFINNKLTMSLRVVLGLTGISLWFLAIQNMSLG